MSASHPSSSSRFCYSISDPVPYNATVKAKGGPSTWFPVTNMRDLEGGAGSCLCLGHVCLRVCVYIPLSKINVQKQNFKKKRLNSASCCSLLFFLVSILSEVFITSLNIIMKVYLLCLMHLIVCVSVENLGYSSNTDILNH